MKNNLLKVLMFLTSAVSLVVCVVMAVQYPDVGLYVGAGASAVVVFVSLGG